MKLMRRFFGAIRDRYLDVDPRTAGLFRIVLASLLVLDLLRHASVLEVYYTIDGVFPNDKHLWRPSSGYLFSIFHAFSSKAEVYALFALGLMSHLALLVGYRTRTFAILSFLFVTSRDSRIPLIENGGYVVVNLVCLYACVLPIGRRFSVDAFRASWARRKETNAAELADRSAILGDVTPMRSLFGFLVVFNLAFVYFFNVVNKTGHIWRAGDTVHYVLHLDRMVTGVAVLAREWLPGALLKVGDFATLSVEALIFACILWPRARFYTRLVAMGLMISLHGMLGIMMRLGPFSWFLIAWSLLLLLPAHWQWRQERHRGERVRLRINEQSPLALTLARVLVRMDSYQKVTIEAGAAPGTLFEVLDHQTNELGPRVARALPFGARLTSRLFGPLLHFLTTHEAALTRFFGLSDVPRPLVVAAPIRARLGRFKAGLREVFGAYFLVCVVMQMWLENKVIPKQIPPELKAGQVLRPDEQKALSLVRGVLGDRVITLKPESPKFLQITITYPRLFQGWGMFAPNPIQDDGVLAVNAWTIDGRRIDPLRNASPDLDLTDSRGEGLGQIAQDYGNRIRQDRNQQHRDGLADYLRSVHLRSGNPQDEIVGFDVYWVRDKCPPPGQSKPTHGEAVGLLSWRKPNFRFPDGTRLPPPPRIKSAEKWD